MGAATKLPAWWLRQADCIHRHESLDWHRVTDWTGAYSRDHGGMQIDVDTWRAYRLDGFPTDPATATRIQQLEVAYRIWRANGQRWGGQWPNSSRECGLE